MEDKQNEEYNSIPLGTIRIGTSGITMPGSKDTFPESYRSTTRLRYYSSIFNSTEINSSFHKIPLARTFAKWSAEVSSDFLFTIKLYRGITHAKNLLFNEHEISLFMQAAHHLDNNKGVLLIQFPASINFAYFDQVKTIIGIIQKSNQHRPFRLALELRHKSWYNDTTFEFLEDNGIALVFHDLPASKPSLDNAFTDTIYLRFHGPKGDYRGGYSDDFIKDYADRIKEWSMEGKDVYAYFNNTMGDAFKNAQLLKSFCES
jgi:uncharacterized protein YecE (DUF72 family)